MARLSKADWFLEGMKILSEFAQDKIKILYLCKRLGVTRGSFYHHFESIDAYVEDLMEHWVETNTKAFIAAADQKADPLQRIQVLNELVMRTDNAVEASIRSWSYYNAIVHQRVAAVDTMRMDYLKSIFQAGGMDVPTAEAMAKLEYALLIGVQQLFPKVKPEELAQLYQVHQQFSTVEL